MDNNWLTVDVKNKFATGDRMELVMPSGNVSFQLNEMTTLTGDATDVAPGSGHVVKFPVPEEIDPTTIDQFAMLVRYLPRRDRLAPAALQRR